MALLLNGNSIHCVVCGEDDCDVNTVLECAECNKCCHLRCKKLFGTAAAKAREKKYLCSIECKEMHMRQDSDGRMENLMQLMIGEFQAMKKMNEATRDQLSNVIAEVENSQSFLSDKFDDVMREIKRLNSEQCSLKQQVDEVRDNYNQLNSTVVTLEAVVDKFNRASLARNAIILGVPIIKHENVVNVVKSVAAVVNYELPEGAIVEAKRIRDSKTDEKYAPIRVIFAHEEMKEKLFFQKRAFGPLKISLLGPDYHSSTGRIIVRDEMTPHGLSLLREVREMQESLKLKFVWPGRDGVILVKRTDDSKIEHVRDRNDARKLSSRNSKRALDESRTKYAETSSDSLSPPIEQQKKRR